MMKLIKTFIVIVTLFTYNVSFSQNNDSINKKISMILDGGISFFDGDIPQKNLLPGSIPQFTLGGAIEYHLTDTYSVSLDNYYYSLKGENNYAYINTKLMEFDINSNINLNKIVFPRNTSKITINCSIGLGLSYYNFNTIEKEANSSITKLIYPKNDISINVPISLYINHQISENVSIGYKLKYVSNNKDNLEGIMIKGTSYKGVTNDYISSGTIYLKYTINNKNGIKNRDKKITVVNRMNKDTIINYNLEQNNYNIIINNKFEKTNGYNDTIKIHTNNDSINDSMLKNNYIPSIFFDFDKHNLNRNSEIIINSVVDKMKKNQDYKVEIKGYCDGKGDYEYNLKLSNDRCNEIKNMLIHNGISENRIVTNGMGKINFPKTKYKYNRRCDLIIF